MLEVIKQENHIVLPGDVEGLFNKGAYVILVDEKAKELYKLSMVEGDEYAYIHLNGSSWASGSYYSIRKMTLDALENLENSRIYIFRTTSEYIEWLANEWEVV